MNILVRPDAHKATTGTVSFKGKIFPCALGRSGVIPGDAKREGDGATPSGVYPLRTLWVRRDKLQGRDPECALPERTISILDGWSDDPASPNYNRYIQLQFDISSGDPKNTTPESHEVLWRLKDDLYDLIVDIGYNDDPPVPGRGSAIFLHVARPEMTPTAGCVAMKKEDLVELLAMIDADTQIEILEA